MTKTHRIKLNPTPEQAGYFYRASGVARFAWNWALNEYKRLKGEELPVSWNQIKIDFRAKIDADFPFVREVTKCAAEEGIGDLRKAVNVYFKTKKENPKSKIKFPGYRKRSKKVGGFGLANDKFRVDGHNAWIPKLGIVNLTEKLRFDGRILSGRVKERAGCWYLTVTVECQSQPVASLSGSVGIDFGMLGVPPKEATGGFTLPFAATTNAGLGDIRCECRFLDALELSNDLAIEIDLQDPLAKSVVKPLCVASSRCFGYNTLIHLASQSRLPYFCASLYRVSLASKRVAVTAVVTLARSKKLAHFCNSIGFMVKASSRSGFTTDIVAKSRIIALERIYPILFTLIKQRKVVNTFKHGKLKVLPPIFSDSFIEAPRVSSPSVFLHSFLDVLSLANIAFVVLQILYSINARKVKIVFHKEIIRELLRICNFGLKQFATLSTGEVVETQACFRKSERRLKGLQRGLARKQKGSRNRAKWKLKVARMHARIKSQRSDFLHKFTTAVASTLAIVCIEDLNLAGFSRTRLARSFADAGIGEAVTQLEYKTSWFGGILQKVDRFFASSKLCNRCRVKNTELKLSDREWDCLNCGSHHDRDGNASLNIKLEGIRLLAGSVAPSASTPVDVKALAYASA